MTTMSPRIVTRIATTIACVSLLLVGCSDDGGGGGPMGGGDLGPLTPSGNDAADMLALVNSHRASGADCGSEGVFGPAPALTRSAVLEQSAQAHTQDMQDRGFFAHRNPDGQEPWHRLDDVGYDWSRVAENISQSGSVESAMAGWMASDGHCSNIMNPDLTEFGMGNVGRLWTQVFATPR